MISSRSTLVSYIAHVRTDLTPALEARIDVGRSQMLIMNECFLLNSAFLVLNSTDRPFVVSSQMLTMSGRSYS